MSLVAEEAHAGTAPEAAVQQFAIDDHNPWLGLESFTEETRRYFHGREGEIAELARRVQRKLLAILFGQSGLGKTSILRAGIVPRLRREGFCPVYVRIDYAPGSPSPSEQIKQAIFRATEALGQWSKPGSAIPGESLWEFLHHRDDVLQDAGGRTLLPLLIFDQFEEIFTLGQNDDFGRKRAAEFIQDLADLVENRPPGELAAQLESEDAVVERFDFNRADYRILIALREDYLAHLEGFKAAMPSITQNRMRLARMTGEQALAAVTRPGGTLVSEEVAESIVRFVAGGAELRNAEVEPSLLSLICRELNNARVAQGRAEISADLLAGSRDTILNEFYERALVDQPAGVRRFIEDEMLTESGHRESLGEERVVRAFATAGAGPEALAALVNRRLLRIEERLDLRRVELTHDVLCEVVRESRERRHEREAKEEAQRQLEAQRAREAATRKALVRARRIAAGCALLAIAALAGAMFGYQNMKRAQVAEARAVETRAMAEGARSEAEKLIVFLLDDFYLELEPIGRLDVVGDLAKRALEYYAGLPKELRTTETERNRALALVRYALVLRNQAKLDEGAKVGTEAVEILGRLQREGDRSEVTAIGLGMGLSALARVRDSSGRFDEAMKLAAEGAQAFSPLMAAPSPSFAALRSYAYVMNYLGFLQMRQLREDEGVRSLQAARQAYRSITEKDPDNVAAAAGYTESSAWQMEALSRLKRRAEAKVIGEEALATATQILERRPGHMGALRARALLASNLAALENMEFRGSAALALLARSESDWETFLKLDPGNAIAWNNLASVRARTGFTLDSMGRSQEGDAKVRSALAIERNTRLVATTAMGLAFIAAGLAESLADHNDPKQAAAMLAEIKRYTEISRASLPAESVRARMLPTFHKFQGEHLALIAGHAEAARDGLRATLKFLESFPEAKGTDALLVEGVSLNTQGELGRALYRLGEFKEAEKSLRYAIDARAKRGQQNTGDELWRDMEERILIALAVGRQGRLAEAAGLIEPELKRHRAIAAGGSDRLYQQVYLALAELAAAVANPAQSAPLLAQAAARIDRLPADLTRRRSTMLVRGWIAEEMKRRP